MTSNTNANSWTAIRAYGLAIICLAVGMLAGYLAHAPKAAAPVPVASNAVASTDSAAPSVAPPVSTPEPSPEQLKTASTKAAMPVLEQLKTNPKNFKLLVQAGEMYYHHGAFADAGGYYDRALAVKDDVAVRNQYASALFYGGKPDAALEQYAKVLKVKPDNDLALFNSGMITLKAKNNPKGAVEFWEKLLKTHPNHPQRAQVQHMIEKVSQQKS